MTSTDETNRKKFSNWLQGVHSLHVTKQSLHDYVLEKWKKTLASWDKGERDHIPCFLKCVAGDKIKVINNNTVSKKEKGTEKRKWLCVCEHSVCNKILEKILALQQNPGFNIIWNSNICEKLSKNESQADDSQASESQVEEEDGTENIPRAETTSITYAWSFIRDWLSYITNSNQTNHQIKYKDIFDNCTQKHIWCIANMFMQRGKAETDIGNTGPQDTDPSMFFKMMKNCKLFEIENENYLYDDVILCRDKLHHSASNRVCQEEAKAYLKYMINLLKAFENIPKCKEAIQNIEKMLQETVMFLSVKNVDIELARTALKMKKDALEEDAKVDTTRGFGNDETKDVLDDTAKALERMSDSKTATLTYNGMKSREDYKREHKKVDEIQQNLKKLEKENETLKHAKKTTITASSDSSQFSARDDEQVKERLAKLTNILVTAPSHQTVFAKITEEILPVLDQVTKDVSEIDETIKEKVDEVNAEEKSYQKPSKDEQSSWDETEGLQTRSDNTSSASTVKTLEGNAVVHSPDTEGYDQLSTIQNSEQHYKVRLYGEPDEHGFLTCCRISPTTILLADRTNKKLKKLDDEYGVVSSLDLCEWPFDLCYLGNNECVVALLGRKLQFVDVGSDMELTNSVDINHECAGLTYHDDQLYVINDKSVYIYSRECKMQHVLYTHKSSKTAFRHIAINENIGKIYITCFENGLVTIDTSGNYINTFSDPEFMRACGVCLDGEGNVLVCGSRSSKILKIGSDGKQKLETIENKLDGEVDMTALYFDRQKEMLISSGTSGCITIIKLK